MKILSNNKELLKILEGIEDGEDIENIETEESQDVDIESSEKNFKEVDVEKNSEESAEITDKPKEDNVKSDSLIVLDNGLERLEEEVILSIDEFFAPSNVKPSERMSLDKILKKNIEEDKFKDILYVYMNDSDFYEKYVKLSVDFEELKRNVYVIFAEKILEDNYRYIGNLLFPDEDLTPVHMRAYKLKMKKLNELINNSLFISIELEEINSKIEDLDCDIVEADEELAKRKTISNEIDRFLLSETYAFLCTDKDDFSGRDWVLHGKGSKYGRLYISYETKEKRGLTLEEFYGGGVVD